MEKEFNIKRSVPLILSSSDINSSNINTDYYPSTVTTNNTVGTITKCRSDVTWKINFEELLGDLYRKYNKFNIELVQFTTIAKNGGGSSLNSGAVPTNRALNLYISGLDWVNSSFSKGCNKSKAFLCCVSSGTTGINPTTQVSLTPQEYELSNLQFIKCKNASINIVLSSIVNGLDYIPDTDFVSAGTIMHHWSVKLNITPVLE